MEQRTSEGGAAERVLIRYSGDLTTKARATRRRFEMKLVSNLQDALGGREAPKSRVSRGRDRIVIDLAPGTDPAPLARVYGVQSLSIAERQPWASLDDLVDTGERLFREAVAGKRFAVRARRVGDRSQIRIEGQALERALGTRLLAGSAGVDLDDPEVTAHIEVVPGEAYYFHDRVLCPGGLPLGVEGKAVALASGGFDSIVAAHLMQKRGISLDYVFCNLGGRAHQLEALAVLKAIATRWSYGTRPHLHSIDFDAITQNLQARVTQRYWQVVLKRLMLRVAERVAAERGAAAIVTGDAVGQVSSQTLRNIATISSATSLPILRPLIGFNKDEILDIARAIGTYDLSKEVGEYCAMVPSKPATAAQLAVIEAEEEKLDDSLLEAAVAQRTVLDLRELDLAALEMPELEASEIPQDATVLDLRSKAAYELWHYPDALFLDFANALRVYPSMPKEGRYVLYCEFGLKSGHLAELMRRAGYDAVHFRSGLSELLRYARERGVATPFLD